MKRSRGGVGGMRGFILSVINGKIAYKLKIVF
jgi:hypothetical protein